MRLRHQHDTLFYILEFISLYFIAGCHTDIYSIHTDVCGRSVANKIPGHSLCQKLSMHTALCTYGSSAGQGPVQRPTLRVTLQTSPVHLRFPWFSVKDISESNFFIPIVFFFTQRGLHSHPWMTPVTHPSSRLQEATQCPSRITCRQEKHMSGPGPQQPSAVHISSHTLFSVTFRGQEKDSSGLLGALSSWCLLSD